MMVDTGFDYEFDSLQLKKDDLSTAFSLLINSGSTSTSRWTIRPVLMTFAPALLKLVRDPFLCRGSRCNNAAIQPWPSTGLERLRAATKILNRIGDQLVAERKSAMLRERSHGAKEKSDTSGKDLLTLLVRANLQDSDGMNDSDVRARKCSRLAPSSALGITNAPPRNWYLPYHRS